MISGALAYHSWSIPANTENIIKGEGQNKYFEAYFLLLDMGKICCKTINIIIKYDLNNKTTLYRGLVNYDMRNKILRLVLK